MTPKKHRKTHTSTFEATGVWYAPGTDYDEATTTAGDALHGLTELPDGVRVEIHAISFPQEQEVTDDSR